MQQIEVFHTANFEPMWMQKSVTSVFPHHEDIFQVAEFAY
jgi:hypothetical protein